MDDYETDLQKWNLLEEKLMKNLYGSKKPQQTKIY